MYSVAVWGCIAAHSMLSRLRFINLFIMLTTQWKINGMHCASCKLLIEDVCKETPGVSECEVDSATGLMTMAHEESTDLTKLKSEIEALGEYKVETAV